MNEHDAAAVKLVLEWHAEPGGGDAFARWLEQLVADCAAAPGYEGSSVFSSHGDWLLLVRFADEASLRRWRDASTTRERLAAAAPFARATRQPQQRHGLATWFTLPGSAATPPRWKMALVTWCALLPQVLILGELMPARLPHLARTALGTAIPVVMLTWVVMPWLTRRLRRWLFRADAAAAAPVTERAAP